MQIWLLCILQYTLFWIVNHLLHQGHKHRTLYWLQWVFHLRHITHSPALSPSHELKRICSCVEHFEARSGELENKCPTRGWYKGSTVPVTKPPRGLENIECSRRLRLIKIIHVHLFCSCHFCQVKSDSQDWDTGGIFSTAAVRFAYKQNLTGLFEIYQICKDLVRKGYLLHKGIEKTTFRTGIWLEMHHLWHLWNYLCGWMPLWLHVACVCVCVCVCVFVCARVKQGHKHLES